MRKAADMNYEIKDIFTGDKLFAVRVVLTGRTYRHIKQFMVTKDFTYRMARESAEQYAKITIDRNNKLPTEDVVQQLAETIIDKERKRDQKAAAARTRTKIDVDSVLQRYKPRTGTFGYENIYGEDAKQNTPL